jgi:type I restriction enzyme, S subunit
MNLNTSLINVPKINLPRRDGQIAIAKMLSDMDTELTALEARRNKTCDQKKAKMQERLTGRIRLVDPEPQVELQT